MPSSAVMPPAETMPPQRLKRFNNRTSLDSMTLMRMFTEVMSAWPIERLDVRVRYSRSSDFSGTLFYRTERVLVNLGRHLTYPYPMETYIARAVTIRKSWWKPLHTIELADGYQVALFVFLHECYHWLIKRADRNIRQKESMCDRFAARTLVDLYGAQIYDPQGEPVPREEWDFQDLDRFVAGVNLRRRRTRTPLRRAAREPQIVPRSFQYELFLG